MTGCLIKNGPSSQPNLPLLFFLTSPPNWCQPFQPKSSHPTVSIERQLRQQRKEWIFVSEWRETAEPGSFMKIKSCLKLQAWCLCRPWLFSQSSICSMYGVIHSICWDIYSTLMISSHCYQILLNTTQCDNICKGNKYMVHYNNAVFLSNLWDECTHGLHTCVLSQSSSSSRLPEL